MIPTPDAFSLATRSNSFAASDSVSDAVGSSRMSRRTSARNALAISAICWWARESSRTLRSGSRSNPELPDDLDRPAVHRRSIEEAALGQFSAEKQILFHGEIGHETEFLEHRADADEPRRMWRQMTDVLALELEVAGVGRVGSGDDVDERGLACAVLAEENMDLATAKLEIDAVQRHHAGEILRYPGKLQKKHVVAGRRGDPRRAVLRWTRLRSFPVSQCVLQRIKEPSRNRPP